MSRRISKDFLIPEETNESYFNIRMTNEIGEEEFLAGAKTN